MLVYHFDKIDSYSSYKSVSKAINRYPVTSRQRYHHKLLANMLSTLVAIGLIEEEIKPSIFLTWSICDESIIIWNIKTVHTDVPYHVWLLSDCWK